MILKGSQHGGAKAASLKTQWDRAARPQTHADHLARLRNKCRATPNRNHFQ